MLKLLFGEKIWYDGLLINSGESYNVLMLLVAVLVIAAVAYLLGNVNTAILITRLVYKEDIRTKGSGNPGMTNVMRNYGWLPALFTLLGDMFKCMLAMVVGTLGFGILGAYIAGLFCVLGHIAPVIYKFKGGKGVSSSAMFLLYVNPLAFLITLIIFVLIVLSTKYLSRHYGPYDAVASLQNGGNDGSGRRYGVQPHQSNNNTARRFTRRVLTQREYQAYHEQDRAPLQYQAYGQEG